jgi:hypothetical protein
MPNHVHLIVVPRSEDGLRRALGEFRGIPGTSMSKPLSRRSRDFFAGIPNIYSASPGSGRQESTYEPAPFTLTRSWGLSPQERELGTTTVFLSTRGGSARQIGRTPRIARAITVGCAHHITQRGNSRQDVFFVDYM